MPTGQVIINNALTRLGILEQGGTPSAADSVDALANLNDMWDAWSIDEGLIFAEVPDQQIGPIPPNTPSFLLGPSQPTPRPSRIFSAYMVQTVGSSQTRRVLKMVDAATYFGHSDLSASASTSDELYADYAADGADGHMTVYVWPVPTCPTTTYLNLVIGAAFSSWSLAVNYALPTGYEDAITWALAFRLLSTFGAAVAPEVAQNVTAIGSKAEARIREMNAKNRMLSPGAANSPETILQQAAAAPQKV